MFGDDDFLTPASVTTNRKEWLIADTMMGTDRLFYGNGKWFEVGAGFLETLEEEPGLASPGSQAAARDERGGGSRRYPPLTQGAAPSLACCRVPVGATMARSNPPRPRRPPP